MVYIYTYVHTYKCAYFARASLQATGRLGFRCFLVASHGKGCTRVPEPSVTRKQMVRVNMCVTLAPLIESQGLKASIFILLLFNMQTNVFFKHEKCEMADAGTRIPPSLAKQEAASKLA